MSVAATGLERSTNPRRAFWASGTRRVLQRLLAAFNRLVPPPDRARDAGLPAEWFKYPPI